jgi:hypothetical protein
VIFPTKTALSICLAAGISVVSNLAFAQGGDFGGVRVDETISIYNNALVLNGAGLSVVGKNKAYVVQAYAKQKFNTLDELMAAPGPKRLIVTALSEVDTAPIVKHFNRHLEDNNRSNMTSLVPGMVGIGDLFKSKRTLAPGEVMTLDWIPIYGFTIYIDGKLKGTPYRQPELYKAAMSVWMGDNNLDSKVKNALLGKS